MNHLSRNKLLVTKHQSQPKQQQQHQINNPQTLHAADESHQLMKHHQSGDGSEGDCLSDSTIEKMRQQVRMQREKVEEDER